VVLVDQSWREIEHRNSARKPRASPGGLLSPLEVLYSFVIESWSVRALIALSACVFAFAIAFASFLKISSRASFPITILVPFSSPLLPVLASSLASRKTQNRNPLSIVLAKLAAYLNLQGDKAA